VKERSKSRIKNRTHFDPMRPRVRIIFRVKQQSLPSA
jgi:hypothetical protein